MNSCCLVKLLWMDGLELQRSPLWGVSGSLGGRERQGDDSAWK